ncbi:MAG: hypothetical protein DMG06_17310 [Acidobacteria bacterium]|nr:MAG: hypothetical protein DMG06_17310 [Acidobacteriota bacterium]
MEKLANCDCWPGPVKSPLTQLHWGTALADARATELGGASGALLVAAWVCDKFVSYFLKSCAAWSEGSLVEAASLWKGAYPPDAPSPSGAS